MRLYPVAPADPIPSRLLTFDAADWFGSAGDSMSAWSDARRQWVVDHDGFWGAAGDTLTEIRERVAIRRAL